MKQPSIAITHEFLVQFGGAEKTLEAICEIYPEAPVYTAKYNPKNISQTIKSHKILCPFNGVLSGISKYFFAFLMAPVFEGMDFRKFDIVLSDGNTWNKGILTKPDQLHITYVHTPPRFLYGYSTESTKRNFWLFRPFFSYLDNLLRLWDFVAAQRPDFILTNSEETRKRIQKFYRRDATVIYPPVEVDLCKNCEKNNIEKPYYVATGRLIKYKNFDLLIQAFNLLGFPLVIVGTGAHEKSLKAMAKSNIVFKGRLGDKEKHTVIHNALGLINPVKDEDFGIVPVEAMAHGVPVLAHKSGGHMETVIENLNGMFFEDLEMEHLVEKLKEFDSKVRSGFYDKAKIQESAQRFSKQRFVNEYSQFVNEKWEKFKKA